MYLTAKTEKFHSMNFLSKKNSQITIAAELYYSAASPQNSNPSRIFELKENLNYNDPYKSLEQSSEFEKKKFKLKVKLIRIRWATLLLYMYIYYHRAPQILLSIHIYVHLDHSCNKYSNLIGY